jgi:hypothetical protein
MFNLLDYLKVKDKYCIVYHGSSSEELLQLVAVRPIIEQELKGIEVYIACRDDLLSYIVDTASDTKNKLLSTSELDVQSFGYVRELKTDLVNNPVESFLLESKLSQSLRVFHKIAGNWKKSK